MLLWREARWVIAGALGVGILAGLTVGSQLIGREVELSSLDSLVPQGPLTVEQEMERADCLFPSYECAPGEDCWRKIGLDEQVHRGLLWVAFGTCDEKKVARIRASWKQARAR